MKKTEADVKGLLGHLQAPGDANFRNWQLIRFSCEAPGPDGYYCGQVLRWTGTAFEDVAECRIKTQIRDPDTVSPHDAVQIGADDSGTALFHVEPKTLGRFQLTEDLYKCGSAQAVPVFYDYDTGQWCRTDGECGGGGSGSGGSGSGSGAASPCAGSWQSRAVTVIDTIGVRAPSSARLGPGQLALVGEIVWAAHKGDPDIAEVVAVGKNCCALPYGSGSGSGSGGCCEAEVLEDIDDDVLDHVDVDVVSTCVDGEIHNVVTVTETRKTLNKTKKTIQFACCEE